MQTAIQVCNAALKKNHQIEPLPADALTNPVGKAAMLCAEFYDHARREVFRLAPWNCIAKRLRLVRNEWAPGADYTLGYLIFTALGVFRCTVAGTSGATTPVWATTGSIADGTATWTFSYAIATVPGENLTGRMYQYAVPADIIKQITVCGSDSYPVDMLYEGGVLYSDAAEIILVYVPDVIIPSAWDPLLTEAVITQLASMIAFPLAGSHENETAFAQAVQGIAQAAIVETRREKRPGPPPSDEWLDGLFPKRKA